MWVQVVIIAISLILVVYFLRFGRASTISAGKKAGLVLLAIAMVVTVLNPAMTTWVAQRMGVGRGADLLLYALTMAFVVYALTQYTNRQRERDAMHRIARRVALLEAAATYGERPTPPDVPATPSRDELSQD